MWTSVLARDQNPEPRFLYAVKSTGIYCRPSCPSRRPLRKNVEFFPSGQLAEQNGYRACLRCHPDAIPPEAQLAERVAQACQEIDQSEREPTLADLAALTDLSPFHLQRTFKQVLGVTPKAYARANRRRKVRQLIAQTDGSITAAVYDAGYNSSSRFYETATQALGMSPSQLRRGGAGVRILFAIGDCRLGVVLIASTDKGVCALLLGDTPEAVLEDLQSRFPNAELIGDDPHYQALIGHILPFVEAPKLGFDLPLDIQGTAFQTRVWAALRDIPVGDTASYSEIANQIGAPKSSRAVAQACGANPLAIVVPCHRVVRADGGLSGYRWGVDRKAQILELEKDAG
ncbi:MAG: bifunctional DNA-binding transcriptional regulator/O6-methylguanine-DNA methyltransferase Ada [Thalassovita sp.]